MRIGLLRVVRPAALLGLLLSAAVHAAPVPIKWLETPPQTATGVAFGVPWPKASVQKNQQFALTTGDGKTLPLQTWPLAYWPDGSVKWSGFATVAPGNTPGPFTLDTAASAPAAGGIKITETPTSFDISTGTADTPGLTCRISKTGGNLIDTLNIGDRTIAQNARLDLLLQRGPEPTPGSAAAPRETFTSSIKKVSVENAGPWRAVIKIEGVHKSASREWLPFHVRLTFHAGTAPVRMVHTIFFDGNEAEDFIRGLGVAVDVPFKEEVQNRHVRFGGQEGGLWAEPVAPLTGWNGTFTNPIGGGGGGGGRGGFGGGGGVFGQQLNGQRIANRAQLNDQSRELLDAWVKWDDFRLLQPNANGFTVEKRTGDTVSWLSAGAGSRASGMAYVGDVTGGLGIGHKDFWQSYPVSMEVRNARSETAELRAWLWSPEGPAMDMRHYDTVAHGLNPAYEDVELPLATAKGIARTSELTLFPYSAVPTRQETAGHAKAAQQPPLLVCTPQYLHSVKAFGVWSLQDRSTPFKAACEAQLDNTIGVYLKAVDQYNWYGFWNYGDVMHAYDAQRQAWRYDIGGFAWDNSEQGTDMFLWYMFLRSGRADLFRLAEAMTRHTGEVDSYHAGPLAGLGTRHNVSHWGDGAKEARIAMAPYRRYYYYLTADERTGDVMREMLRAEYSLAVLDPMRKVMPPTDEDKKFTARIRGGPDWMALVGNWMTEWERTGDTRWRDKIYAGIDSIAGFPYWFKTSQNLLWRFDPETGKLWPRDMNPGGYNLVNNMGGPEIFMEMNEFIDHPVWMKIWSQYCRLTNTSDAAILTRDKETGNEGATAQFGGGGRISGYAYRLTGNVAFAQRAIGGIRPNPERYATYERLTGPNVLKPLDVPPGFNGLITNNANQDSLQMIEVLELCRDQLPTEVPPPPPAEGRGRGGRGGAGRGARGGPAATAPGAP